MVDTEYGKLPSLEIDFSSAISVERKKMLSKKAIDSVGSYFEEILGTPNGKTVLIRHGDLVTHGALGR